MALQPSEAMALGQKMWLQIMRRRSYGNTSSMRPNGIRECLDYYRGVHSLRFVSDEFASYFNNRFTGFSDNWCAPVIDSAAERLNWMGIRLGNDTRDADVEFQRVMEANDVASGMSEAFTVALACGRSFALVWGNPDDESTPQVTFEHPEFCTLAIDPDTGRTTAAAKGWVDDGQGYLTLYTADEVWKWKWQVSDRDTTNPRKQPHHDDPASEKDDTAPEWMPRTEVDGTWPIPNPLGRVPMVEFRNQTLLDDMPLSDLAGVAAMQDAINLTWAYLFNSLDFASLPQRIMTGADYPSVPVLDDQGQVVAKKPLDLKRLMKERVLWVPDADAKPGSWPAADLSVFGHVIEMAVDHVASQTRTPPHYLMGKMSNTAAESLTVAETGLVAKVCQRQQYFTRAIRELHTLVALAQGGDDGAARAKEAATGRIVWQDPQYRSLAQKTDAFLKLGQAGLPLQYRLEWWGLDPTEVTRVIALAKANPELMVSGTPLHAAPGQPMPRGFNEIPAQTTPTSPAQRGE